ncbi:hypothetical protein E9549_03935 [Blastococcus sp. MG754426]|uniref:hypothetical protein n=1 Tax=unclassified Blastococcus TaxID=2619396 RepID=UPI001EF0F905|nr:MULTISPECIES: hypothetical protein [unclassified Blastococcus]MCF6506561.1 hypothetical protein [Blastococcus sp. MG754426]MCF6510271.1 hypothetical protein [Blastococcus sp. MG754427]
MGDAQLLHDLLGADSLLLTPEEAVRLLQGGCGTTIRQRPPARADAGAKALPFQPDVIAGWEGLR